MNAVAFRLLPVPNPQQLVAAEKVSATQRSPRFSWPQFEEARNELQGGRADRLHLPDRHERQVGTHGVRADRTRDGAAGVGRVLRRPAAAAAGRTAAAAVRQHDRRRSSGGGHQRRLLAAAVSPGARRRRPHLVINGTTLSIVGVTGPEFFGAIVGAAQSRDLGPADDAAGRPLRVEREQRGDGDPRKPWPPQRRHRMARRVAARAGTTPTRPAVAAAFPRPASARQPQQRQSYRDPTPRPLQRIARSTSSSIPATRGLSSLRRRKSTSPLIVLLGDGRRAAGDRLRQRREPADQPRERARPRDRDPPLDRRRTRRVIRQLLAETLLLAAVGGGPRAAAAAWGATCCSRMFTAAAAQSTSTPASTGECSRFSSR